MKSNKKNFKKILFFIYVFSFFYLGAVNEKTPLDRNGKRVQPSLSTSPNFNNIYHEKPVVDEKKVGIMVLQSYPPKYKLYEINKNKGVIIDR